MATTSQKRQLNQYNKDIKNQAADEKRTKKKYNTAYNDYKKTAKKGYQPSKTVLGYRTESDNALKAAKKLGEFKYNSAYKGNIESLLNDAANMKFQGNYSLTDDPVYQQYRDQAIHNAQLGMRDAMGSAMANSGGYGSTAAQAAAQQAYNEQITQLNNIVPEMYQRSFENQMTVFNEQRGSLLNLAQAYQSLDEQTFNQELSAWTTNFNKYMELAQAYNEKYEYLDQAERREYETRLSALYNLMTTAQADYQYAGNRLDNTKSNKTNLVNEIASYDQTEKWNTANLAEQRRQFDAQMAYNKEKDEKDRETQITLANLNSGTPTGSYTYEQVYKKSGGNVMTEGEFKAAKNASGGMISNANQQFLDNYTTAKKFNNYQEYLNAVYQYYS